MVIVFFQSRKAMPAHACSVHARCRRARRSGASKRAGDDSHRYAVRLLRKQRRRRDESVDGLVAWWRLGGRDQVLAPIERRGARQAREEIDDRQEDGQQLW